MNIKYMLSAVLCISLSYNCVAYTDGYFTFTIL